MVETDVRRLFWNHWSILGSTMGNAGEFEEVLEALDRGLRPRVDSIYPLGEVTAALEHLDRAEHFGKVILQVANS